jgi:large subunit ribosomal protein L31
MKPEIHPDYQMATITCACGASYETRSTRGSFAVDVCAACHPFYTGRQKIMDTAGRVERFKKKYAKSEKAKAEAKAEAAKAAAAKTEAATAD